MGFDDITRKAQDLLGSQKAQDALKSKTAEGISDNVLNGVADTVDKLTGGRFDAQIDGARDAADKRIGTDDHTVTTDQGLRTDGRDGAGKPLRTDGGNGTDKPLGDR